MYWLPKMHKTSIGAICIVASNCCGTKPLSDTTSKLFKMILNTVTRFQTQSFFHSGCEKFWVVQNYFPIAAKLNKINVKKKAKSILAFEFSILSTTIPHKLPLKVLSEVINFVFKSKFRKRIGLCKHISIGLLRELEEDTSLNKLLSINKCLFTLLLVWFLNKILVYQWQFTQHHFRPTSFFNSLNLNCIKQLISNGPSKEYEYHGVSRFTDVLCAINDDNEFLTSFINIYPKVLDLNVEHLGNHASFLDLGIKVDCFHI